MSYLAHCIYASSATRDFHVSDLTQILEVSRRNNASLGVTGILVHVDGSFFQVLEGEASVIKSLYEKISHDPRHSSVTRIICEAIPHRYFEDWSMGFLDVSTEEITEIIGRQNFVPNYPELTAAIGEGRAQKLLRAFREGRWRKRVTGARHLVAA